MVEKLTQQEKFQRKIEAFKAKVDAQESANSTDKKKAIFLFVFELKAGNISEACKSVPIDRGTYYNWYDTDKNFKEACEAVRESLIDFAESKLMQKIGEGDTIATLFFLKTIGKGRGYIEKSQFEHSGKLTLTEILKKVKDGESDE